MSPEQALFNRRADLEKSLRGATLIASTHVEPILMTMVYLSNKEQWDKPEDSKYLKIKNLTFGGKITRLKDVLSEYHSDLLVKYEEFFKDLEAFKDIRNKIAHSAIEWLDEKCERLRIYDFAETPAKFQFYSPVEYNYLSLSLYIITAFNKIAPPLTELHNEIESRLRKNHPDFYLAISSALDTGQEKTNHL